MVEPVGSAEQRSVWMVRRCKEVAVVVAFFALVGVVLLIRPLMNRSKKPERPMKPQS